MLIITNASLYIMSVIPAVCRAGIQSLLKRIGFRLKDCRNDSFMGIFGSMTIIYLMSKNVGILDFSEIFQEKKLYCSLIEIILLRRFYSKSEGLF